MSNIDDFYRKECEKIDSNCIDAYTDFHLDEDNPAGLCLDTSWGGDCLDLTSIVKAAETVTTLHLTPEENPTCLQFEREDGQSDCIHGDDLSRIISMTKLKDVDQTTAPVNGDVYMYNNGKFYTFNLQQYMDNTAQTIANMQAAIRQLQVLLNYWQVPEDLPENAKIMLGNINLYSDTGAVINSDGTVQSLNKNNGIYGHDLDIDRAQDEIFG
jgi:hypothetical protein